METFDGYKIRILRRKNSLTIQELAKLVNLSPSAIGMYERGVRRPDLSLAMKLSEIFNLSIDYFYSNDEESQPDVIQHIQKLIENVDFKEISEKEKIKKEVLKRANGYCELCNSFAPFIGNDGVPYLEIHKVNSQGIKITSEDAVFVALCPNCYRRLQILELKGDIIYLINKVKEN
ncbi:helix-turn-helix transcriptional regulator [Bacillus sp. FJAT-53711]|uniref:Helix-turn-helix transcriptional regulator n=1 Tax=Bacillus yunxiaonensis TaxID=3127665 RepID=A0ABU8G2Z4_9BACI